jgi:hypothetical protein
MLHDNWVILHAELIIADHQEVILCCDTLQKLQIIYIYICVCVCVCVYVCVE